MSPERIEAIAKAAAVLDWYTLSAREVAEFCEMARRLKQLEAAHMQRRTGFVSAITTAPSITIEMQNSNR
jgi:hypothetical protein